jgi:hypothetical protein
LIDNFKKQDAGALDLADIQTLYTPFKTPGKASQGVSCKFHTTGQPRNERREVSRHDIVRINQASVQKALVLNLLHAPTATCFVAWIDQEIHNLRFNADYFPDLKARPVSSNK